MTPRTARVTVTAALLLGAAAAPAFMLGAGGTPALLPGAGAAPAAAAPAAGQAPPSLPARIGAPALFAADTDHHPAGRASVAFSGGRWRPGGSSGEVAVVGAADDSYRLVAGHGGTAGQSAVLSPDGSRIATRDGIVDLGTGRRSRWSGTAEEPERAPVAWSPDGRWVALLDYRLDQPGGAPAGQPEMQAGPTWLRLGRQTLRLADTGTGSVTEVSALSTDRLMPGWTAAFAPDGRSLAYQSGDVVQVVRLDGTPVSRFTVTHGSHLAGRGAFSPDGRWLLLATATRCACGHGYPVRWDLTRVSATAGQPGGQVASVAGALSVRVLGWWNGREPAVEVAEPQLPAPPNPLRELADQQALLADGDTEAVRVVALDGSPAGRTLLSGERLQVSAVEVADDVLRRAALRAGEPPLATSDRVLAVLVALLAAGLLVPVLHALARRRRHTAAMLPDGG
jgi:hypothetical protein